LDQPDDIAHAAPPIDGTLEDATPAKAQGGHSP
jgi:hypothetical protein